MAAVYAIDPSKVKTLAITIASACALFFKAGEHGQVKRIVYQGIAMHVDYHAVPELHRIREELSIHNTRGLYVWSARTITKVFDRRSCEAADSPTLYRHVSRKIELALECPLCAATAFSAEFDHEGVLGYYEFAEPECGCPVRLAVDDNTTGIVIEEDDS